MNSTKEVVNWMTELGLIDNRGGELQWLHAGSGRLVALEPGHQFSYEALLLAALKEWMEAREYQWVVFSLPTERRLGWDVSFRADAYREKGNHHSGRIYKTTELLALATAAWELHTAMQRAVTELVTEEITEA